MHGMLYANLTTWRVAEVSAFGERIYTLGLARGEGEGVETAYVDVEAWEDRAGDCWLCVLAMGLHTGRNAVSQSAAAWVREQPEHELGALVLDWDLRRAS